MAYWVLICRPLQQQLEAAIVPLPSLLNLSHSICQVAIIYNIDLISAVRKNRTEQDRHLLCSAIVRNGRPIRSGHTVQQQQVR